MDRMIFETDVERQRSTPVEPTIPGPTTKDSERIYNADYSFAATHQAVDPGTFTDLNTKWADSAVGNDANPGTQAQPYRTLQQSLNVAIAGGFPYIAAKGTFRSRNSSAGNIRICGWPGSIPTWEAPDNYPAHQPFAPPGGPVAFRPSFGGYRIDTTNFYYMGGSWDINSVHDVILQTQVWNQLATGTWNSRQPAVLTPTTVKRTVFDPRVGGIPLAFVANAPVASGFRSTWFQYNGLDAIPDSNVQNGPLNIVSGAYYTGANLNWEITTVDVAYGRDATRQLMALNYNNHVVGTAHKSLTLYSASTMVTNWKQVWHEEFTSVADIVYLSPNNVTPIFVTASSRFEWHTLRYTNKRYYLLQPHAPAAGIAVFIIDPLRAWDENGNLLNFSPPQGRGAGNGVTLDYVTTRTTDIQYYNGLYYLTTDTGIYASVDGLTGWAIVFNDGNLVPRFMHICNNVLFCSAERSLGTTLAAGETRLLYTFDGITWNYYTITQDYAGEVFSLGGAIVGIASIISSTAPYRYIQEPMFWNKNTNVNNWEVHIENFNIDLRSKCGSFDGDWFGASV